MIRNYLKDHSKVHVFSKTNYFGMIDYMYRDEGNIVVTEIEGGPNEVFQAEEYYKNSSCDEFLRIGFEHYPFHQEHLYDKNCWEFFYEQIQVPYSVRYEYFHVERDEEEEQRVFDKLNPDNEPYIFIHEDADRGFLLNREHFIDKNLKVIENDVTENIFHFTKILEDAQEIHCMESSFKTLIDFYCKQDNIFYHDFRHQPLGQNSLDKWKVIKY